MNTTEKRTLTPTLVTPWATSELVTHGIIGGIVAGIIFALAEMIISVATGGPFFGPLRLISSIALGVEAVDPSYPFLTAGLVGLIVHVLLSALYGVIFVSLLAANKQLQASTGLLLLYGSVFGLLLWVVNFLVIAPAAFPQFTEVNQFLNGFLAHTFFYGTVLGAYVANTLSNRTAITTRVE